MQSINFIQSMLAVIVILNTPHIRATESFSSSKDSFKLAGSPGSLKSIMEKKSEIESKIGRPIETIDQIPASAFAAFSKGILNGLAFGGKFEDLVKDLESKKIPHESIDSYEVCYFSQSTVMAVVHPENPVITLTRAQLTDLISGKLKTWQPINGKTHAVKIVLNSAQMATKSGIPRYYIGKDEIPSVEYVTTLKAVAKHMEMDPGVISFSGSKFEDGAFKPKFLDTEYKIVYSAVFKKPLSGEAKKILEILKCTK